MPPLFARIKTRLLGARYDISFSYIRPTAMRALNKRYRKYDEPTDVLAFALTPTQGEIVMCRSMIIKKSRIFGMNATDYARFLFIHACLHLKGKKHGRIMEGLEDRWCGAFRIPLPVRDGNTHRRRHRRRYAPRARSGRTRRTGRRTA